MPEQELTIAIDARWIFEALSGVEGWQAAVLGLVDRPDIEELGMEVRDKLYRVRDALQ